MLSGGLRRRSSRGHLLVALLGAAALLLVGPDAGAHPSAARQLASSPGHAPVPVYSSADGVACPQPSYCVAVGAYNANDVITPLTELWDGSAWSVVPNLAPSGAVSSVLNAVSCTGAADCLAVGYYTDQNAMAWGLSEAWDGSTWTVVDSPRPVNGTDVVLNGVSCATSACLAVGSYTNAQSVPVTLTESWSGSSWSIVDSPNPTGATSSGLSAVSCPSDSACMASGSDIDSAGVEVTLAETWNGTGWSITPSPDPAGARASSLAGISCPQPSACLAVGRYENPSRTNRTLAEAWDGTHWSIVPSATPTGSPNSSLDGVSCGSAAGCLAVGHSYRPSFAAKDATLVESWDGSSWTIVTAPTPSVSSALYAVSCSGSSSCLAAGLFFNSSSSYQTLAEQWNGTSMAIVNQDAQLAGVACADASHCVAVGSAIARGKVAVTTAEAWNGSIWRLVPTPDPRRSTGSYLSGITCTGASRCLAVGYYYAPDNSRRTLVEAWNGKRWSIRPSPNRAGEAYSVLYGVSCLRASRCMAVGSTGGRVLAESLKDGRWSIVPSANPRTTAYAELTGVSCRSASRCLAVGYETDTRYHADLPLAEQWNGSRWRIVPSAAPGKNRFLSSVLHDMSCARAGCFAVGFRQRASGTFATFGQRWSGRRWAAITTPSPSGTVYSDLNGIDCVSDQSCLAVGTSFTKDGGFATLSERMSANAWTIVPGPAPGPLPFGISYLLDVSCLRSSACLAVGATGDPASFHPLRQRWDGSAWTSYQRRG